MSTETALPNTLPLVLRLGPLRHKFSDAEFFELCRSNPGLSIERTSEGDLVMMSPSGGKTGNQHTRLVARLGAWAEADGSGLLFDASTGFLLPNGAVRSPDVAWVRRSRWETLTESEQAGFPPLCPDFVLELRSPTDRLKDLSEKMAEYLANGAELGWLIDPLEKKVHVYRASEAAVALDHPETIAGEPLMQGFVLRLAEIWT